MSQNIFKYLKHSVIYCLMMLCIPAFLFTGCKDEGLNIDEPGNQEDGNYGDAFSFRIKLAEEDATRATDDELTAMDNYIDENKLRVMIFDKDDNFLFEVEDPKLDKQDDGFYHLTVSINDIKDDQDNPLVRTLRDKFKTEKFKIAVLANWPTTSSVWKENPNFSWGYDQSALKSTSGCKKIHDLHHIVTEIYYNQDDDRIAVYQDMLMEDKKMGAYTDWVKMDITDGQITAMTPNDGRKAGDLWLRNYWDPTTRKGGDNWPKCYNDMWNLWNFGGGYTNNNPSTADIIKANYTDAEISSAKRSYQATQWNTRINNDFKTWFDKYGDDHIITASEAFTDYDGLTLVPGPTTTGSTNPSKVYKKNNYKGIVLYKANKIEKDGNDPVVSVHDTKNSVGFLRFPASGTGWIRIKFGSYNGQNTEVVVQKGSSFVRKRSTSNTVPTDYEENGAGREIQIAGDTEYIYVFCNSDNPAIIYSIEFISNKYFYDTDRIGILPSESQPIPMYGVQEFEPIKDWKESVVKDISKTDDVKHPIYVELIRSLAKVELYLTKKAEYVYMRSMNRTAWCEPMDVSTSTSQTWVTSHSKDAEQLCEWYSVQKYGAGYGKSDDYANYRNWLSWFYGSWKNAKWLENGTKGWNFSGVTVPSAGVNTPYPRIYNPYINRSDFCKFNYVGQVGSYHKYVLYVPDKNIDDPNTVGILSSAPKVAHIEYRYPEMCTGDFALDDNNCHRLYFTDYDGTYTTMNPILTKEPGYGGVYADEYDLSTGGYEYSNSNLSYHWPIMRNHVYRFYVGGSGSYEQTIRAEISDWGYQKEKVEW